MADHYTHPNTRCVRTACERLDIPFKVHDEYGNFISVTLDPVRFFVNAFTPFNSSSVDKICKDKEFTYRLLKDVARMPRTKGYFDPHPQDARYESYVVEASYEAVAESIVRDFGLPVMVKMNSGALGTNVYLCTMSDDVLIAVKTIFNHDLPSSDFVALAQEYIKGVKEYRAIVFRGEVLLLYEKDISNATFTGNLSPLHYENSHAVLVTDAALLRRVQGAIAGIFPVLPLEYCGIDLIEDSTGEFHIIELNSHPGLHHFVKDNGDEPVVQMYEYILKLCSRI